MKILVTGGHLAPALAVIDEFLQRKNIEIVFVGRKFTDRKEQDLSLEYKEITKKEIPFLHLRAGRLTRTFTMASIRNGFQIPAGFLQAWNILQKEKPDIILSFGSYLAVPIALCGFLQGVSVYTHEQTIHPGLANILIGKFARKIFVSFEETVRFFDTSKVVMSGNPVRLQIFEVKNKPFDVPQDRPVIYITGGSLGSHSINEHIENILPELLSRYTVIHQTGNVQEYHDYERLHQAASLLDENKRNRYFIAKHFLASEIGYIYSVSDVVISRSGANTFFELIQLKKPAVLIPLPWSAHNEQKKQAKLFKRLGTGEVFDQSDKSEHLLESIDGVVEHLTSYKNNFDKLESTYHQHAASIIVSTITES